MTMTSPPTRSMNGSARQGGRDPGPPAPSSAGRLPRVRRQRRPALAAAGALLVVLCGVASAALTLSGDARVPVLALARDVQAGHVLSAQDLRVAKLAGDGLSALSADGAAAVAGQTVTASLPAGTLLNNSMLSRQPLPGSGLQLVAVAVKPGGAPVEAVPGRDVTLVRVVTTADPRAAVEPQVLVARARVVSVRTEAANGLLVLTVQVPNASAVAVAQASAAGAVAVTLLPVTP
jgi:hypothetical protein